MVTEFIARVELHHGTKKEYDGLHEFMEQKGFKTTVERDGCEYYLPPGEYRLIKDLSMHEVMGLAKSAAGKTRMKFSILVSEVSNLSLFDLKQKEKGFSSSTNK